MSTSSRLLVSSRVDAEIAEAVKRFAKQDRRTLSNAVEVLLQRALQQEQQAVVSHGCTAL